MMAKQREVYFVLISESKIIACGLRWQKSRKLQRAVKRKSKGLHAVKVVAYILDW